MGNRANALTDHQVTDFQNQAAVLSMLESTLPVLRKVDAYWQSTQENYSDSRTTWAARFIHNPPEDDYLRYDGPVGFSVNFGRRVARVSGPCRWSGFCTMPELQRPHAEAFRVISRTLGGSRVVLIPDYDPVDQVALHDGGSLDECIEFLKRSWSFPQVAVSIVTENVDEYYRRKSPAWFVEELNPV